MMNNYDERQILIKNKIFMRAYFIVLVLLLANAFLHSYDIIWADGFISSVIISVLSLVISGSEAIVRDVFFTKPREKAAFLLFPELGIVLLVLNITHVNDGEKIISDGALTRTGCSIVVSVLFIIIGVVAGIKFVRDKLREKGGEE